MESEIERLKYIAKQQDEKIKYLEQKKKGESPKKSQKPKDASVDDKRVFVLSNYFHTTYQFQ